MKYVFFFVYEELLVWPGAYEAESQHELVSIVKKVLKYF